jgi:hypothetical protein
MAKLKIDGGSHWYSGAGEAAHETDGKKTTLVHARKAKLYPSVTTIDKDVFKNDFLDNWKLEQVALAAYENQRGFGETEKVYCERIYQASLAKSIEASDKGKIIHKAIEDENWDNPFAKPVLTWIAEHTLGAYNEEVVVDHDLGVAGTCDFNAQGIGKYDGMTVVADWKTQKVKRTDSGKLSPAFYDSFTRQLAFYRGALAKARKTDSKWVCVSIVVDSVDQGNIFVKEWTEHEIKDAYMDFVAGAYLWFSKRGYWPQPNGPFTLNPSIPLL